MNAKVKIAPIEQWCEMHREQAKLNPDMRRLVGLEITILPESMVQKEGGRSWTLTRESYLLMAAACGLGDPERFHTGTICEHMLEMD
jgi:hypothetical protein